MMKSLLLGSKNSVLKVCVYLTHGGEELGHPVWIALLTGCEDPEQSFEAQVGQAGALLLPPRVLHHAGDVGVTPHQHTGLTETNQDKQQQQYKNKEKSPTKAVIMSQGSQTSSCHRGSGRFCLCFVHLGRLCVQFPPAVGSSAQPHLLHNAQTLHLSEALTEPPLCSEYCLWKKWLFLCLGVLSNAIQFTFNTYTPVNFYLKSAQYTQLQDYMFVFCYIQFIQ